MRLVKLADQPKTRGYGAWKGLVEMADDWDSVETNAAIAKLIHDSPIEPQNRARMPKKTRAAKVRTSAGS